MYSMRSAFPAPSNPIWLPVLLLFLGRLFFPVTTAPLGIRLPLLLALITLTGISTAFLARRSRLEPRPQERFVMMSLLGALAIPLPLALVESKLPVRDLSFLSAMLFPQGAYPLYLNIAIIFTLIVIAGSSIVSVLYLFTRLRSLSLPPLMTNLAALALSWLASMLHMPLLVQQLFLLCYAFSLPMLLASLFITPYLLAKRLSAAQRLAFHIAMLTCICLYFLSQILLYFIAA